MGLDIRQIQQLMTELAALECLKIFISTFFLVVIDLILFKVADNKGMHNILDVFQLWPGCGQQTTELVAFEHQKIPL